MHLRFGGTYCLRLQGRRADQSRNRWVTDITVNCGEKYYVLVGHDFFGGEGCYGEEQQFVWRLQLIIVYFGEMAIRDGWLLIDLRTHVVDAYSNEY